MANVFDTAKYILEVCGSMHAMKLQKLCYYAQAWSLVWDGSPLFNEEFQAWAKGPVCPQLFDKTIGFFHPQASDETGGEGDLTDSQKDTINTVLEHYAPLDQFSLSELILFEEPWNDAREGVPPGPDCKNIITKESMAAYYGKHCSYMQEAAG